VSGGALLLGSCVALLGLARLGLLGGGFFCLGCGWCWCLSYVVLSRLLQSYGVPWAGFGSGGFFAFGGLGIRHGCVWDGGGGCVLVLLEGVCSGGDVGGRWVVVCLVFLGVLVAGWCSVFAMRRCGWVFLVVVCLRGCFCVEVLGCCSLWDVVCLVGIGCDLLSSL